MADTECKKVQLFEKNPWEMTKEERIEAASKYKEKGNSLFAEGKIEDAKENYSNGIKRLIPVLDASKDEVINSLKLVLYLNLAACQMKLKQYENVIENCTKALNINNTNTKALYRRSMALTEVNRFEQAYKDAKQGLLIEENNQAFKGQLLEIQRRTKIETDKYKKMVKNCFTEKRIDVCDKEKEET